MECTINEGPCDRLCEPQQSSKHLSNFLFQLKSIGAKILPYDEMSCAYLSNTAPVLYSWALYHGAYNK